MRSCFSAHFTSRTSSLRPRPGVGQDALEVVVEHRLSPAAARAACGGGGSFPLWRLARSLRPDVALVALVAARWLLPRWLGSRRLVRSAGPGRAAEPSLRRAWSAVGRVRPLAAIALAVLAVVVSRHRPASRHCRINRPARRAWRQLLLSAARSRPIWRGRGWSWHRGEQAGIAAVSTARLHFLRRASASPGPVAAC